MTEAPTQPIDLTAMLDQRAASYGQFVNHAQISQSMKRVARVFIDARARPLADDQQEALDMIFVKIGRIINGDPDFHDSWNDIAGYAQLVADRLVGIVR